MTSKSATSSRLKVFSKSSFPLSSSSKSTILKGPKYTQWDLEKPKPSEPYENRLFEIPFTIAANELVHIGGLGVRPGQRRSKTHPARPPVVQQILNQRTGNRINFTLTNDIELAKKSIPTRKMGNKTAKEQLIRIVNRVCYADNLKSPQSPRTLTPSSVGSESTLLPPTTTIYGQGQGQELQEEEFYKKPKTILEDLTPDVVQSRISSPSAEVDVLDYVKNLQINPLSIKVDGNEKTKPVQKTKSNKSKNKDNNFQMVNLQTKGAKKATIRGSLFGPFTKTEKQTFPTQLNKKFQFPKSMVSRIIKDYKAKSVNEKEERRARLFHMNRALPPSTDESSNEEDQEFDDVKCLTFIKTPYFTIPTVKLERKPRKSRLKSRFLNNSQLNRIRYLLLSKSGQNKEIIHPQEEVADNTDKVLKGFPEEKGKSKSAQVKGTVNKFRAFVRDCYLRNADDDKSKPVTKGESGFISYKHHRLRDQPSKTKREEDEKNVRVKKIALFDDEGSKTGYKLKQKNFKICKPPPIFNRSAASKTFREIDSRDPVAMDPNFMTKLRYPKFLKVGEKDKNADIFMSTMRYSVGTRKRLQVEGTDYNDELFGHNTEYLHRLATEWDEDFVNELQHNKKFKKFRLKTDIIHMREIIRKNFIMYYMTENLINLRHKQEREREFIEDLHQFSKMCTEYLGKLKDESYNSVIKKTHNLKPLEAKTRELMDRKKTLNAELEHSTETLLGIEQHWDIIMRLQNYYYVLMNTEWRQKFDWIHRKSNGTLEEAIFSVQNCRSANIRPKENPNGFEIISYFNENIFPNIEKMKSVKPSAELLKKGLQTLQSEVFVYLNQYNKTLLVYDKITQIYNAANKKFNDQLDAKKKLVYFKQLQQEFVDERNHVLRYEAEKITDKPLQKVVKNFQIRKVSAICDELYFNAIPVEQRSKEIDARMDSIEKLSKLHNYLVLDLLYELDKLPTMVLNFTEKNTRENRRKYLMNAQKFLLKQTRFELLENQLRGFFNLKKKIKKSEDGQARAHVPII